MCLLSGRSCNDMNRTARPLRRDTRIFISAVSRELGTVRQIVKKGLEDNGYHAVEQDNFEPDYRDLVDKLRKKIDSCDAVVHIAGHCYGAEPRNRPEDAPRRSYTQLEYDIANELGLPVYVFLTGDAFPSDPHKPESDELRALQEAHRQRLTSTGRDYSRVGATEQLDQRIRSLQLKVERLEGELQQVDEKVAATGSRLKRWLSAVAALVLIVLAVGGVIAWRQHVENTRQEIARRKAAEEFAKAEQARQAAEADRKERETVRIVQQEIAERLLNKLLVDKKITPEDARRQALQELPDVIKLPLSEIEAIVNRKIPPTKEATLTPLERALAALDKDDYLQVLQVADKQKVESRELAMVEGTAAQSRNSARLPSRN